MKICVICGEHSIALQPRKRRFTADITSFSWWCKDDANREQNQIYLVMPRCSSSSRLQRYGARNGMSSVWGRYFERLQDLRLAVFGYSGIQLFAWAGGGENNPLVIIIFKYYYYKKFSSPSTSRFVLLNTWIPWIPLSFPKKGWLDFYFQN